MMNKDLIDMIRDYYDTNEFISLHAPVFQGNEKKYVLDTIESTYVSSVGAYVTRFEELIMGYTNSSEAIATVNGTAALHVALKLANVGQNDLVITQALTFVATCNAISYCGAKPVFIDVDMSTLGLSPKALENWLEKHATIEGGYCQHKKSNQIIKACLPMHTFGHPVQLDELVSVCNKWKITLIEDAAESLGSLYKGKHTGTFGQLGILSFNGNKTITTGGGGMILTNNEEIGDKAKHLTTTSKQPHSYEFIHDEVGYNYRLPNINAALGCAQLEQIEGYLQQKRKLASLYEAFFKDQSVQFVKEPDECRSNYWLNAIICEDRNQRDEVLKVTNDSNVMTRPIWKLMNKLKMFNNCYSDDLKNSSWLEERIVNIPSGIKP